MKTHKFEKVLVDNGFILKEIIPKIFCGRPFKDLFYVNSAYKGHVSVILWETGIYGDAIHYFMQSNGTITSYVCETNMEIDRNLKSCYQGKK